MKLSYPIATPEVRAAILGLKGPLDEMLPALRDLGYTAIEPFIADPAAFDSGAWISTVRGSGLTVAAVGTGPVVFDDGLTFTHPDPVRRHAAISRAKAIVDFAAELQAQVNIGKLRGEIAPSPGASFSRDWMIAGFLEVCAHADKRGVVITLEPQNKGIINNLNTTAQAMSWLKELQIPNLKLMLDVFHMNVEQENIPAELIAARSVLQHIHYADTDRRPPGQGALDFSAITRQLRAIGYDSAITVEIKQSPDPLSAARASAQFLLPLLSSP